MVRIGEVAHVGKEHGQVGLGIAERHAEQDALVALPAVGSALHVVEVVVADGGEQRIVAEHEAQAQRGKEDVAEGREYQEQDDGGDKGDAANLEHELPPPS